MDNQSQKTRGMKAQMILIFVESNYKGRTHGLSSIDETHPVSRQRGQSRNMFFWIDEQLIEVEFTNNKLQDVIYWNTSERTASR